jgi:RNA polymerase sigma-70 factor (ECF subfamily)
MQTNGFRQNTLADGSPNARAGQRPAERDGQLLLEYVATGSQQAFAELVRLYERELYRYLYRRLNDTQLAEDAFQNTFLQLHRKCRQFEPGRRLRPWLDTIAGNQAIDLVRRTQRHKAVSLTAAGDDAETAPERRPLSDFVDSAAVGPAERLEQHDDRERTRSALGNVPEKVRQVLMLIAYQGLAYREAAEALGIPLGTVKSRMNNALQCLHRALLVTGRGGVPNKGGKLILEKG